MAEKKKKTPGGTVKGYSFYSRLSERSAPSHVGQSLDAVHVYENGYGYIEYGFCPGSRIQLTRETTLRLFQLIEGLRSGTEKTFKKKQPMDCPEIDSSHPRFPPRRYR